MFDFDMDSDMGSDSGEKRYCDVCGAELEPDDYDLNLCKICQEMEWEEHEAD